MLQNQLQLKSKYYFREIIKDKYKKGDNLNMIIILFFIHKKLD